MHNQPIQPLDDLETLRVENERLRNMLFHLANYVSVNIHYVDPVLDAIISQAIQTVHQSSPDNE